MTHQSYKEHKFTTDSADLPKYICGDELIEYFDLLQWHAMQCQCTQNISAIHQKFTIYSMSDQSLRT